MPFPNTFGTGFRTSTTGGGRTAYGQVPGAIATPPSVYSQLAGVPGFSANTSRTGNVIGSELAGTVGQGTLNALKTASAQFGVGSGMPGSGLEQNQLFGNIAGFSEGQQHRGVQDYFGQVGALGPTMTNPNLAAEISARNSNLAAAPDPRLAAEQQFNDWLRGFQYTQGAAGYGNIGRWPGGGTLGPERGFGTTHSNWGGMGGLPPDALGFPGYDMTSQQGYGVYTAGATPPPGGWQEPAPWNAGFAVGSKGNNPYFYSGTPAGEAASLDEQYPY